MSIIVAALIDTGSRMDEVIFEEFQGIGKRELYRDRKRADKGVFPALDMMRSGTREEDLPLSPEAMEKA